MKQQLNTQALEVSGKMTKQDAIEWWSSILNLFVEYNVNLTDVEETFLDRANIRPGALELFKLLSENNIPTIILSAGIREVIDIWYRKYEIKPSLVVSTSLFLDNEKRISGWHNETLVHVLNKSEATHAELHAIQSNRPKALLVGDGLDDADMVAGEDNVIRVRVLDPRADESATKLEGARTFKKFDALIRSGSFEPLYDLVEAII